MIVHIDGLARKLHSRETSSSGRTRTVQSPLSTDRGLHTGTLMTSETPSGRSPPGEIAPRLPDTRGSFPSSQQQQTQQDGTRVPVTTVEMAHEVAARRLATLIKKKLDKCPLCKMVHYFDRNWLRVTPPTITKMVSTRLTSCAKFLAQSPEQRAVLVMSQGVCSVCMSWDHTRHQGVGGGPSGELKCREKVNGVECGKKHGAWYHASASGTGCVGECGQGCQADSTSPGLYEVYSAELKNSQGGVEAGTLFIDPGSDTDYIWHDYAQSLGLVGEPYVCHLKVIDMEYVEKKTAKYEMDILDRHGHFHRVTAIGLDSIMTLPPEPDLEPLRPLLREFPPRY